MIYTSYFANWRNFPAGAEQVSIALFPPKGFKGTQLISLAPRVELLNAYKKKQIDEETFEKVYRELLQTRRITGRLIADWLESDNDVILLCYEKPDEFCHRHIVAEILREDGIEVKEL